MCVNCKAVSMKYLILSLFLVSTIAVAKTPQEILREEGFVLASKESGKEVYYRPKEVKKHDGIVYYSTTIFYTAGSNKYGLKSNYDAIACKEKKVIRLSINKFIGFHRDPICVLLHPKRNKHESFSCWFKKRTLSKASSVVLSNAN